MSSVHSNLPSETDSKGPEVSSSQQINEGHHLTRYLNRLIAAELSTFTRYSDRVIQLQQRDNDAGRILRSLDAPSRHVAASVSELPASLTQPDDRSVVLLNGNFNHDFDIEGKLRELRTRIGRHTRVAVVLYNPYLRAMYQLANLFGIRRGEQPSTFVTTVDLNNLARLSGFEVVRLRPVGFCPLRLGGIGNVLNSICPAIPLLRELSLAWVAVLRPVAESKPRPSVTVVIPARNEKGNIEAALQRMPMFDGRPPEVVFVEGHSKDGTWEEIERVAALYKDRLPIQCFRQTGKGKSDAVRLGFAKARHDLLMILDADLTMPPELLGRFYDAFCAGHADFVNGSRLVYPMEGNAMKFLNRLGNVFFAKALSTVLDTRLGDSLCGTKVMLKRDYDRMTAWRNDFGDFDPFGDFEMLFPAAILALGIIDIPIRYRDRVYGSTNIRRFYHGWMLLKMTLVGLSRVKLGRTPPNQPQTGR